jgi:hypothetical protein
VYTDYMAVQSQMKSKVRMMKVAEKAILFLQLLASPCISDCSETEGIISLKSCCKLDHILVGSDGCIDKVNVADDEEKLIAYDGISPGESNLGHLENIAIDR